MSYCYMLVPKADNYFIVDITKKTPKHKHRHPLKNLQAVNNAQKEKY